METSRIELRRAFIAGYRDAISGGITQETPDVNDHHDLINAYSAGEAHMLKLVRAEAQRLTEALDSGANFPVPYGHEETVEDGLRVCSWDVVLPGDLLANRPITMNELIGDMAHVAIMEASEELAEDYVMPATWNAALIAGEPVKSGVPGGSIEVVFRVTRYSKAK